MGRPARPALHLVGKLWHFAFTVAGERHRGSTGESDHGRAEKFLATKWAAAHAAVGRPAPAVGGPRLDLDEIGGLWLSELVELHPDRPATFEARLKGDLAHLGGRYTYPEEITAEAWAQTLVDLRGTLGSRSQLYLTRTTRRVLAYAWRLGAIRELPVLPEPSAKAIAKEAAPRRALSAAERDRVLRALRGRGSHRQARIWQTMVYSGLRWGELEALTLGWLDLRAQVIRVPPTDSKSGQEEEIALHPKARVAIRAEAVSRGVKTNGVPVFGAFDIRRAWKQALVLAKVDPSGITAHHTARHTFGSLVAEKSGGDVTAVLAAGRWRSLSVAQRYVHANAARGKRAIRRL